jgi:hypothetical protein
MQEWSTPWSVMATAFIPSFAVRLISAPTFTVESSME